MKKRIFLTVIILVFSLIVTGCNLIQKKEIDPDQNPVVSLKIKGRGTIEIELYPNMAPNTVNNFISLVDSGFYDGLIFHRVISGFMIQGGDPLGNGLGDPGYSIKGEFSNNGFKDNTLKHTRGVISMARNGINMDSAGSQFFIMVEDKDYLDGEYAAFGKVIKGMDIVDDISNVSVDEEREYKPWDDQIITEATVKTFGHEYPEPKKIK